MSNMKRQVIQAQHRLWLNRWLRQWGWSLLFATAVWTAIWVVSRLFPTLGLPMGWIALAGAVASVAASVTWLVATREHAPTAAAALDEAAGLKERVSTGLHFVQSRDPFAQATQADAEASVAGLSARKFIRIQWAGSLSLSGLMLGVALLSLLLPEFDILNGKEARSKAEAEQASIRRVKLAVARPVEAVRKIMKENPALKAPPELEDLEEKFERAEGKDADVLRREAIKQLDKLSNALKKQAESDRFEALRETKKRMAKIGESADPKAEVGKLIDALARGDLQVAQDTVKKLQEDLARRRHNGKIDPAKAEQMREQLKELARKLREAAQDTRSEQELKNAGLSADDAKRVLEALAKHDPKQLEKLAKELAERLKNKGVTAEQLKKMLDKMKKRQAANKQCNKLGNKMGQAAQKMKDGDMESASQELGEAGEMLSEMEQLDQAMNDLELQMSELDDARDDLSGDDEDDSVCKACNGTGFRKDGSPCPQCNGQGNGQGLGRGGGLRERDDSVKVGFVNRRAKVKLNRHGRIIGQQYVKGRPLKGKSEIEFFDAAHAAELDATDALNRDRVPRIFRKSVKQYFDRLPHVFPSKQPGGDAKPAPGASSE